MIKKRSFKMLLLTLIVALLVSVVSLAGCEFGGADRQDKELINKQQEHYQKVQPLPFYEYSIPRDILTQIYNVVTTKAYTTYTVIESITGETKFHGPSLGYGIPADTQLTNPLKRIPHFEAVIEQAEPNGLFSSKNTDGTWVLFVQDDGVTPIYTEHKVTTYPFPVKKTANGWERIEGSNTAFTVDLDK